MDAFVKEFIIGVPLSTHRSRDKTYPNSFSGKEAIDWMVNQGFAKDRTQATIIGNNLMKSNYFVHITNEHAFVDSEFLFYCYTNKLAIASAKEPELKSRTQTKSGRERPRPITYADLEDYGLKFSLFQEEEEGGETEEEKIPSFQNVSESEKIDISSLSIAPSPVARMGQSAVLYDKKIWIYGGKTNKGNLSDLLIFSCDRNMWVKPFAAQGTTPAQRRSHFSFAFQNKMFLIGGYVNNQKTLMDLYCYDFLSRTWSFVKYESNDNPEARYLPSYVLRDDNLYMLGGQDSSINMEFWKLDLNTNSWTSLPTTISKRWGHSAVLYKNSMFVFGGVNKEGIVFKEFYEYSFEIGKFILVLQPGTLLPEARYGHSCVLIGKEMFMFGGLSSNGMLGDFYKYNFETKVWSQLNSDANSPGPRSFFSMIAYGNFIYIFGGNGSRGLTSTMHRYTIDTNTWSLIETENLQPTQVDNVATIPLEPSTELFCEIHKGLLDEPVQLPCGDIFCNSCIMNSAKCPKCSSSVTSPVKSVPALIAKQKELQIHCKYGCKKDNGVFVVDTEGCPEIIKLGERFLHEANCDHRVVPCPNSTQCGLVKKANLAKHLEECTHCKCAQQEYGCTFQGTSSQLESHKASCPFEQVSWALHRLKSNLLASEEQVKILMKELNRSEQEIARLKAKAEKPSSPPLPTSSPPAPIESMNEKAESDEDSAPKDSTKQRMKKKLAFLFKSM